MRELSSTGVQPPVAENNELGNEDSVPTSDGMVKVFTPYIRKDGKIIFHPKGGLFVFEVTQEQHEAYLAKKAKRKEKSLIKKKTKKSAAKVLKQKEA